MSPPLRSALSFGRLRALADVLRLSPGTMAPLRPFAVELFRAQTAFNHRLVDVLEDAVWTFRLPDHPARLEARLGPLAAAGPNVRRVRGGVQGRLVLWTKRIGLAGLQSALEDPLMRLGETNRLFIGALASRRPLPPIAAYRASFAGKRWLGLERWFEAQAELFEEVTRFVTQSGDSLTDQAAAFARLPPAEPPRPSGSARATVQVLVGDAALDPASAVVLRLPGGEVLAPGAVEAVGEVFAAQPEVQLCYGDTFFTHSGIAALKPSWSPEYLASSNYIGGCFAMRTSLAVRHGLEATAPAISWLLAAPLGDDQVVRIPRVLSTRSTPEVDERERGLVAQKLGARATVEQHRAHRTVRLQPAGQPLVSIIVPFRDRVSLLRGLWSSIQRHDPGLPFELLLVSNQSRERATLEFVEQIRDPRVSWFAWDKPFNWSAINNAAAARAKGSLLLFLNNDTEVTQPGWLRDLAGYASQPEIGVAGARLLYPDRTVQHAGVVIGLRELAGHVFARWSPEYGSTPFGSPEPTRNWSAVTGACLMIRRALFEEVGGFDERMRVSGGDVELCLRVRRRGHRVVCVGHVELLHFESVSRRDDGVPAEDIRRERAAYAEMLAKGDPYYHPLLSDEVGHGGLGPRVRAETGPLARKSF